MRELSLRSHRFGQDYLTRRIVSHDSTDTSIRARLDGTQIERISRKRERLASDREADIGRYRIARNGEKALADCARRIKRTRNTGIDGLRALRVDDEERRAGVDNGLIRNNDNAGSAHRHALSHDLPECGEGGDGPSMIFL